MELKMSWMLLVALSMNGPWVEMGRWETQQECMDAGGAFNREAGKNNQDDWWFKCKEADLNLGSAAPRAKLPKPASEG